MMKRVPDAITCRRLHGHNSEIYARQYKPTSIKSTCNTCELALHDLGPLGLPMLFAGHRTMLAWNLTFCAFHQHFPMAKSVIKYSRSRADLDVGIDAAIWSLFV